MTDTSTARAWRERADAVADQCAEPALLVSMDMGRSITAGTVWVNCHEEGNMTAPFGGFEQSGNGHDKSAHPLEKHIETTRIAP